MKYYSSFKAIKAAKMALIVDRLAEIKSEMAALRGETQKRHEEYMLLKSQLPDGKIDGLYYAANLRTSIQSRFDGRAAREYIERTAPGRRWYYATECRVLTLKPKEHTIVVPHMAVVT